MNDITPKEAIEILRHYTDLGYGIVIEGEDTTKIKQALDLASETLANGTPYNPTGDCISRSELMKAIGTMVEAEMPIDEKWALGLKYSLKVIDNAPTVEPFEPDYVGAERLKARQRGYEEGYHNGMKIGKTLNPKIKQGEYISVDTLFAKCSICGNLTRVLKKYNMPNFCPACGADMRNGGAE